MSDEALLSWDLDILTLNSTELMQTAAAVFRQKKETGNGPEETFFEGTEFRGANQQVANILSKAAETAEAKKIDRSQGDSTMQVVAQQMQDMIDNSLLFHARYL